MKLKEIEILIGVILGIVVIASFVNLFFISSPGVKFCGDGIRSKSEMDTCQVDCDWCGDGYCQEGESCQSCQKDCGSCSASSFCGDGICGANECASGCWKDCNYLQCENGICEPDKGETCVNSPNDCKCDNGYCNKENNQCTYQSCGNNICESYESYLNCPNDCKAESYKSTDNSNINYPIIFVHGHSMTEGTVAEGSIDTFKAIQEKLSYDNLYSDEGVLLPSAKEDAIEKGVWGTLNLPVSVRTTYYLGAYDERGNVIGTEDNQHISIYADRLKITIDRLMKYTGKNKVIIIAHSMGGLVSREYVRKYGNEKVDKIITLGTPNYGTHGYSSAFGCNVAHSSPECDDMDSNSNFISVLRQYNAQKTSTRYLAVIGLSSEYLLLVCPNGEASDGVVCKSSAYLENAENYYYQKGSTVTSRLHGALTDPIETPEVYNKIVAFLKI